MKKLESVIVGLTAIWLVGVSGARVQAEEKPGSTLGGYVQYAKLDPVATKPTVRVGPFSLPANAPERLPYPVKLALAQPKVSTAQTAVEHFGEVITVFGERIVPPPNVSSLIHIQEPTARSAADAYQWTFWKFRGASGKPDATTRP